MCEFCAGACRRAGSRNSNGADTFLRSLALLEGEIRPVRGKVDVVVELADVGVIVTANRSSALRPFVRVTLRFSTL